jgi:hypothetical protein
LCFQLAAMQGSAASRSVPRDEPPASRDDVAVALARMQGFKRETRAPHRAPATLERGGGTQARGGRHRKRRATTRASHGQCDRNASPCVRSGLSSMRRGRNTVSALGSVWGKGGTSPTPDTAVDPSARSPKVSHSTDAACPSFGGTTARSRRRPRPVAAPGPDVRFLDPRRDDWLLARAIATERTIIGVMSSWPGSARIGRPAPP